MEGKNLKVVQDVWSSISHNNVDRVRDLLTQYPEIKNYSSTATASWLHQAAWYGHVDMAEMLLTMGDEVNHCNSRKEDTPLEHAISNSQFEMARFLLTRGADPNIGRTLIGAINRDSDELALEFVELLVEHGADVNRVFPWFDDWTTTFTPLSWAVFNDKTAIADYLRSKGAVMPEEKPAPAAAPPKNLADEVVVYFAEHFGPVRPQALIEIVPTEPPITIHVIPPGDDGKHLTLFTTGMSEQPMNVPQGEDEYRFAELFIQLPGDWPLGKRKLSDPNYGWPIIWLRSIAKHPHQEQTWLGGPVTIIANGDPPESLAPNLAFTSLLLLAEKDFVSRDGRTIQLYRLMPLYTEERNLEIEQGIAALLQAFDRLSIPFVVDVTRQNAAIN